MVDFPLKSYRYGINYHLASVDYFNAYIWLQTVTLFATLKSSPELLPPKFSVVSVRKSAGAEYNIIWRGSLSCATVSFYSCCHRTMPLCSEKIEVFSLKSDAWHLSEFFSLKSDTHLSRTILKILVIFT